MTFSFNGGILKLTNEQIQTAITNVPSILYDKSVADKIGFYRKNRPDHLQDYLEGNNNYTLIYLANDIVLTQGITILGSKSEITIDGLYLEQFIPIQI